MSCVVNQNQCITSQLSEQIIAHANASFLEHTVHRTLLDMEFYSRRPTSAALMTKRRCQLRLQWVRKHGD
ncbi:hypothetical protein TNCV_1420881 [Trichonephila clavipes]|nr:hypothetical protein TNCV_1420881 [Trichonephila clavipes]